MLRSLHFRLLLATMAVVIVAVSVTAFVAGQRTTGEFQRYVEHGGNMRYRRLAVTLADLYARQHSWGGIQAQVEQLAQVSGQRVVVADGRDRIVGDSGLGLVGQTVGANWPQPAASILVGGTQVGALYLDPMTGPPEADLAFLSAVKRSLAYGALVTGLAAVLVTWALSGRILRPVQMLTAAAQRMEKGDLTARVQVASRDEIGQLAHAFNAMAGSLSHQEQLRRDMVRDVAHELRTPLTCLRGYLEAARDGLAPLDATLVNNLYEETMLLNRLVADLQELARADAGQLTLLRQPTALPGLIEQAVAALRLQAANKELSLTAQLSPDLPLVDVDAERVGQVLRNLLANAITYTPDGGEILVAAEAAGREVAVSVHDTGDGIAPEHLPYVFDRFYRADGSRTRQTGGAGLGLAIVKQLVTAHGGRVVAHSEPGRGSIFTFTLPVAR